MAGKFYLENRFINVVKNYNKKGITYSPKSESKPTTCILSLDDLEQNPYPFAAAISRRLPGGYFQKLTYQRSPRGNLLKISLGKIC
jgi:hypothetical protein